MLLNPPLRQAANRYQQAFRSAGRIQELNAKDYKIMKKILLIICLFLIENSIKAQDITGIVMGTNFDYETVNVSQHNFSFQTFFSFGYGPTCPQLINPEFVIDNNTLYVKGYYDIRGAWPQAGCQSFNTITYNSTIPSNVTQIIMSTNVIKYGSSETEFEIVENVYIGIFNINLSTPYNPNKNKITFYPNPTKDKINISNDLDFSKIYVSNSLGQIISVIDNNQSGIYDLHNIKSGIYYMHFYLESHIIGVCKLVKEN